MTIPSALALAMPKLSVVPPKEKPLGRPSRRDVWVRVRPLVDARLKEIGRGAQTKLAKHCGVSGASVSAWLSENDKSPEGDNLIKTMEFAGIDPTPYLADLGLSATEVVGTGIAVRDRQWIAAVLKELKFAEEIVSDTSIQMDLHHKEPLHPRQLLRTAIDLARTATQEESGHPPPMPGEEDVAPPSTMPPPRPRGRDRR